MCESLCVRLHGMGGNKENSVFCASALNHFVCFFQNLGALNGMSAKGHLGYSGDKQGHG